MSQFNIAVIIPAAGASRRYHEQAGGGLGGLLGEKGNGGRSKLDEDLGGRPVLQRTVELFNKHPDVTCIIVAGPAEEEAYQAFAGRHGDKLSLLGAKLCKGGRDHRYETVANALKLVPERCTHVAVHDAARPCASEELIERVFGAARPTEDGQKGYDAVIPGIDVPDTLKKVEREWVEDARKDPLAAILGESGKGKKIGRYVEKTLGREDVVAIQTPQVFSRELLVKAYGQKDLTSTDDAQLIEKLIAGMGKEEGKGVRVLVVTGESTNIKITRPGDMRLARAILGVRPPEERAAHKRF